MITARVLALMILASIAVQCVVGTDRTSLMNIAYPTAKAHFGAELKIKDVEEAPAVSWPAEEGSFYTLIKSRRK